LGANSERSWVRAVSCQHGGRDNCGGSWVGNRAWAIGDGQGGRASCSISLVALNHRCCRGTDGCISGYDGCHDCGAVRWWGNTSWGWGGGGDWLGDLARAVGDGESFASSSRIGFSVGGNCCGGRTVGCICGDGLSGPDSGARSSASAGGVPSRGPGVGSGDKSEDGEESLDRLHYCGGEERLLCCRNESGLMLSDGYLKGRDEGRVLLYGALDNEGGWTMCIKEEEAEADGEGRGRNI
jgi:hypothetical protein